MNKAQHEALKAFEGQMYSAYKSNFVRMSMSEFKQIAEIYNDLYGKSLTNSEINCGRCRLKALQRLYNDYMNYKPTGRPKKIDLGEPEQ